MMNNKNMSRLQSNRGSSILSKIKSGKKIIISLSILTLFIPFFGAQALKLVSEIKVKGVEVADQGDDYIKVEWNRVKNTRVKFNQIKVQRKTAAGKYKLVKRVRTKRRTIRQKRVANLNAEKKYYFRVRACRTTKNCGLWSDRVKATTDSEFLIKNLIVDFAPYDESTGRAGAFIFHAGLDRVFYEFVYTDGETVLPTFEYIVAAEAEVYSPIDGVINSVTWQEASSDYEVHINPVMGENQLTAGLDHVLNIQVEEGDIVTAGDVIGNPGTWSGDYGRVELEIFGDNYMHCPFEFFNPKTINEYEQKVSQLMSDWEAFTYDEDVYNEETMIDYAAGCNAWKY